MDNSVQKIVSSRSHCSVRIKVVLINNVCIDGETSRMLCRLRLSKLKKTYYAILASLSLRCRIPIVLFALASQHRITIVAVLGCAMLQCCAPVEGHPLLLAAVPRPRRRGAWDKQNTEKHAPRRSGAKCTSQVVSSPLPPHCDGYSTVLCSFSGPQNWCGPCAVAQPSLPAPAKSPAGTTSSGTTFPLATSAAPNHCPSLRIPDRFIVSRRSSLSNHQARLCPSNRLRVAILELVSPRNGAHCDVIRSYSH